MTLQIFSYLSAALWPAFGEALARSDYVWARRAYNRSLLIGMGMGFATIIPLLLFGQRIISWWAGAEVVPSTMLLVGWAGWFLVSSYGYVQDLLLISQTPLLRRQVVYQTLAALFSLGLKIAFVHYWQSAGVIWGGVIGYGLFFVIPSFVVVRSVLGQPLF